MKLDSVKELRLMANTLRQDIIRMLVPAQSGHTAGPLGLADIFSILFFHEMKYNPSEPGWEGRDRGPVGDIEPVAADAHAGEG